MYDIENQELGTAEPLHEEAIIDDTQMGDVAGATDAPLAEEAPQLEAEPGTELEAEAAPAKPKDNRNWFVVHTYSGYENKVKANLERRIHSMGMQDKIFRVLVPMEDEVEFKDGKRKITPKKVFPGYVLVEMIMDDQSWYVTCWQHAGRDGIRGKSRAGRETCPAARQRGQDDPQADGHRGTEAQDRLQEGRPRQGDVGTVLRLHRRRRRDRAGEGGACARSSRSSGARPRSSWSFSR